MARRSPVLLATMSVIILLILAALILPRFGGDQAPKPILYSVKKSDYRHKLLIPGEVESAVNVDIKCEVPGIGSWRPTIQSVVPDGERVKKGDLVLKIDTSKIEEQLLLQEIHLLEHLAEQRGYETSLQSLEIERDSYAKGDLEIEKLSHSSKIYTARAKEKEKRRIFENSLQLYDKGYITDAQLETDLVSLRKANNELELEILNSDVLERFVSQLKMLTLDTKIYSTEVKIATNRRIILRVEERIKIYRENIEKSVLLAPQDGMAVHVPLRQRGGNQFLQVGEELYNGRIVLRIPNPETMQVAIKIEEADVQRATVGTKARIVFEAIDGAMATGHLESVRPFADAEEWMGRPGQRYSAIVALDKESLRSFADQVRPGLTTEVELLLDSRNEAIQVPNHAMVEIDGSPHCLVWEDGKAVPVPATVLTDNGSFTVLESGPEPGQEVVCGAKTYWEKENSDHKKNGKTDVEKKAEGESTSFAERSAFGKPF